MKVIGITGASGSGKTTVLDIFRRLGCFTIDADEVYHHLLLEDENLRREILTHFPSAGNEAAINRRSLADTVFSEPDKMETLNSITHRYILAAIERMLETGRRHEARFAFIDATLLIESGLSDVCDVVIGVIAPLSRRLARIMRRDNITEEQAMARIRVQQNDEFYIEHCDHIIENSKNDENVAIQVVNLYDQITNGSLDELKKDRPSKE